jgi:phospholipase/carboxylesterase
VAAAVLFQPMVPLHPETLPNLQGKPVLILAGCQDPTVPPDHSERLTAFLRGAGAKVTLQWIDTGHGLTRPEFDTAKLWMESLSFDE